MKIILGSASPRRKELLASLGFDFEVKNIDCDESFPEDLACEKVAEFIAVKKSEAYQKLQKNEILITADTVVECDGEILGKPKHPEDAKLMLKKLSGKIHKVHTALVFKTIEKFSAITDTAEVFCEEINSDKIDYYVEKYNPTDKAGAYGIQEWIGMAKISKINGSFYTIMGFPTHLAFAELMKFPEIKALYFKK